MDKKEILKLVNKGMVTACGLLDSKKVADMPEKEFYDLFVHQTGLGTGPIDTEDEVITTIKAGGSVVLADNIKMNTELSIQKDTVLNLNGKSISSVGNGFSVADGVQLTLEGTGDVMAGAGNNGSFYAVAAEKGSKVVIKDGSYNVGSDENGSGNNTIYSRGGVIEIYGGEFKSAAKYADKYWTLNLQDNKGGSIKVFGGKFYGFDPANGGTENPPVSFVADGYESINIGNDVFEVRRKEPKATVEPVADDIQPDTTVTEEATPKKSRKTKKEAPVVDPEA